MRDEAEHRLGSRWFRAGKLLLELYSFLAELVRDLHVAGKPLVQFYIELYSTLQSIVDTVDRNERCGSSREERTPVRRSWRHILYAVNRSDDMLTDSVRFFQDFYERRVDPAQNWTKIARYGNDFGG